MRLLKSTYNAISTKAVGVPPLPLSLKILCVIPVLSCQEKVGFRPNVLESLHGSISLKL